MKKRRNPPRRTRWYDWLGCSLFLCVALFFAAAGVFGAKYGTTAESDLIVTTGVGLDAKFSSTTNHGDTVEYLRFTVNGHTVDYSTTMKGYDRVLESVKAGLPLTIGVSDRSETLVPHPEWDALYTLSIGSEHFLSYQDTVTKGYRGSHAPFIIAFVLGALAIWGLYTCYRNRNLPTF